MGFKVGDKAKIYDGLEVRKGEIVKIEGEYLAFNVSELFDDSAISLQWYSFRQCRRLVKRREGKRYYCECHMQKNQVCDICSGAPSEEVMRLRLKDEILSKRIEMLELTIQHFKVN